MKEIIAKALFLRCFVKYFFAYLFYSLCITEPYIIKAKFMKFFDNWFKVKPKLEEKNRVPYFKEREIWWTHVGVNIGFEQDGHGE